MTTVTIIWVSTIRTPRVPFQSDPNHFQQLAIKTSYRYLILWTLIRHLAKLDCYAHKSGDNRPSTVKHLLISTNTCQIDVKSTAIRPARWLLKSQMFSELQTTFYWRSLRLCRFLYFVPLYLGVVYKYFLVLCTISNTWYRDVKFVNIG